MKGFSKKIVSLILVVMLIFSLCVQASAYSLSGNQWASTPVYFKHVATGVNLTAFSSAFVDWKYNSDIDFYNSLSNPTLYDNNVYYSGVTWDGLCSSYFSGGYFTEAYCYLNTYYTDNYSADKRQSVAGHEIGHAIGLADLGSSSTSLMNGYTYNRYDVNGVYTAQTDDINGVNYLY